MRIDKVPFILFYLLPAVLWTCHTNNSSSSSTNDSAAALLYSAYGASFTPVPTQGCADSSITTILRGSSTPVTSQNFTYYFYKFVGDSTSTEKFTVSVSSGEADLWIGAEGYTLTPSDFSKVELRSENIGNDTISNVSTTNLAIRCVVVPVSTGGGFTLSIQ
ncbi:hypothetical protein LEP1GSC050_1238 [Leptospira broomii serovar Hurstbridge str. 5399]|uniref:Uncharacterized protein n=1 Tax=Leptospira broomii serovar Hurstbridge str. 5399 TaxID=1049789 RepID=T0F6R3_9LEPT|nr:hypothetical protein [Leptospira broomii]EQA43202.1 hypothetical protein LEP1GSC050_1238 [Leptospira broomii serovar Hurstbridge str. 5399]